MAALGLDVYGSDEEEDVHLAGSGEGVVLVGEYAAAAAATRGDADGGHPAAAEAADSAAGLQAMDVDAAPGASPMVASDSAVPPGSPGGSHPAPGEAVGLPPELARPPPGECSLKMKEKVENYLNITRGHGREIKNELRNSRAYRNPDFLQKMVEHAGIKEFGSNFPADVFDPEHLHEDDFHEALKGAWDKEQERRAAERAATGRIDFTSGSKHAAGSQARGAPPLPKPASASSDVAAVVQKARMQAAAAAAAKAKASRWGPQ